MKSKKNNKRYALRSTLQVGGFTLIEILVFTALVSVFFVVAAAVSAFAINVMKSNENRLYATHYAEETLEWLRNEKEVDWVTFNTHISNWCMVSLGWTSGGPCPTTGATSFQLSSKFNRDVSLSTDAASNVVALVTVSWKDISGITRSVITKTVFSQFE